MSEDEWRTQGLGIPGDSGAWVIDAHTHVLYGQVWARNRVCGPGPRTAWFTPILRGFDHIETVAGLGRPRLPQTDDIIIDKTATQKEISARVQDTAKETTATQEPKLDLVRDTVESCRLVPQASLLNWP